MSLITPDHPVIQAIRAELDSLVDTVQEALALMTQGHSMIFQKIREDLERVEQRLQRLEKPAPATDTPLPRMESGVDL